MPFDVQIFGSESAAGPDTWVIEADVIFPFLHNRRAASPMKIVDVSGADRAALDRLLAM